jgi:LEA14-like dessication related protein
VFWQRHIEGVVQFMKQTIVIALFGAVLGGCATMAGLNEAPRVRLVSITPVDFQLFEQRFVVTLQVQNPNPRDITIRGLDYELAVNDKLFAQGVSGKALTVPAYGENTAEVEVVSTLERVLEQLQELGYRGKPSLDYSISGHVRIDGIPIPVPFEYQSTLEVPGFEKRKRGRDTVQPPASKAIAI